MAAALLATAHLPSAFESEASELGGLLPSSSKALEVESRAIKTFGLPLLTRTIVVADQPAGSPPSRLAAAGRYIAAVDQREGRGAIRAVPLTDARGLLAS